MGWNAGMNPGSQVTIVCFKGKDGREATVRFDWPPARGAVDSLMSQVVGYPVTVGRDGEEIHAVPAVPKRPAILPPQIGYPVISGFIAQCETCDEPSDRARVEDSKPHPWRFGLCVKCRSQPRADQQTWETSTRLTGELKSANEAIASMSSTISDLTDQRDALVKEVVRLKEGLADVRLRAIANSQVAGIMLPAEALRRGPEPYVSPISDVDLLPDA